MKKEEHYRGRKNLQQQRRTGVREDAGERGCGGGGVEGVQP